MGSFFNSITKNRDFSTEVIGSSRVPYLDNNIVTVIAKVGNFKVNTGESPNEVDFFVNFDGARFNKNRLPFNAGQNGSDGEVVTLRVWGPNKSFSYDFPFKLVSSRIVTMGDQRGVSYRGMDYLRTWLAKQPIYTKFNIINSRDYYDNFKSNLGFYWTNSSGSVQFEEANPSSDNWMGLIDAYHALFHVFYSAKRDAQKRGAGSDFPNLKIDPEVASDLKDFILPPKQYQPNNVLSAIMDILQTVSSKYTIAVTATGTNLSQHTLVVTKLGNGPLLRGHANENSSGNKKSALQEYAVANHRPRESSIVVLRDESTADTSRQVDAVKYKGAPIQYFVKNTPLVPAWDWWNDYNIFVRYSHNLKLITRFYPNGTPNPEYPSWLASILDGLPQNYRVENLSRSFDDSTPDSPAARQYIFAIIDYVWNLIMNAMKNISSEERGKYLINFGVMDYLIKPEDPIHRYRFTRYIAIPKGTGSDFIPQVDPKTGWDHPDLKRFKNILPAVVDGKRQNISAAYMTSQLKKTDTYHLTVPTIVEAELPNYTDFDGDFGKRPTSIGGETLSGNTLEWRQLDSVQVDGENGFFFIQSPQDNCMYWDKATVSIGPNPGSYDYYRGGAAVPGQPTNPDEDERQPHFQVPVMKAGGPSGTTVDLEYLPFRTRLRATFYFTKEETYRNLFGSSDDPTLPNWYYDFIAPDPRRNDPWLAGIVTVQDIAGSNRSANISNPRTRFEFVDDNNMVWQVPFYSEDDSRIAMIGNPNDPNDKGLLQSQIFTKDAVPGRVYINLQWRHRDDRKLLEAKAKRKLLELMDPVYSGIVETLDGFDIGYQSFMFSGNGYGLGSISYNNKKMPISGFSISFVDLRTTLEFDITPPRYGMPFEAERVTPVFAAEAFQALDDNSRLARLDSKQIMQDGINRPRKKHGQLDKGYKFPWEAKREEQRFYTTPNYQYGRKAPVPTSSDTNPGIDIIKSLGKSMLPTANAERESFALASISQLPELKNATPVTQTYLQDEGKS